MYGVWTATCHLTTPEWVFECVRRSSFCKKDGHGFTVPIHGALASIASGRIDFLRDICVVPYLEKLILVEIRKYPCFCDLFGTPEVVPPV